MKQIIFILIFATTGVFGNAFATYNANISGQLESVLIYSHGDFIYFRLKNQPTAHPGCDPTLFAISETVPVDRRKIMLARLSLAYAMQEVVNIGYDSVGECIGGYIQVHRVG